MRPSGLPLPPLLGFTRMADLVTPSGESQPLATAEVVVRETSALVSTSSTGAAFAKPIVANKGAGAFRLDPSTLESKAGALCRAVSNTDYLFQEAIHQHDGMSALYPYSLNTLRVLVGKRPGSPATPLSVIVRTGSDGRPVDNAHAGGIFVGVDLETGRLKKHGHQLYSFGGKRFMTHPDTGLAFDGYVVPRFDEVMDVVLRAHEWMPHPYSGWDIGITPEGPVIVECNPGPYVLMMDVAHGGLKADPIFRYYLSSQGVLRPGRSPRVSWPMASPATCRRRGTSLVPIVYP
ncbi:sugar-transfer associated ATP-grasp domain-containing protein [Rubrivirga sp.]|uniref:sugar-transfer associated ATP-grasp domain-containing protein n=1 Tax=Rubrivirga sp. TaxID=1885344 RepID=UPI003B523F8A